MVALPLETGDEFPPSGLGFELPQPRYQIDSEIYTYHKLNHKYFYAGISIKTNPEAIPDPEEMSDPLADEESC